LDAVISNPGGSRIVFFTAHRSAARRMAGRYLSGKPGGAVISSFTRVMETLLSTAILF
jgi:hypothetical protein